MNNENIRTTSTSASVSNNSSANINATSTTSSLASISSLSSLPVSSFAASTSHFDATVNAIAAVVNASSNLPVTPPNAAVVVAVAVSSLAAAIIPDTPIVSIAGSTLSEITTTTTSTRTTPTPVPTTKETNTSKNIIKKESQNSRPSDSLLTLKSSSSASVKQPHRQMSVANSSVQGDTTNATRAAANVDNDSQTNSCATSKGSSTTARNQDTSAGISSAASEAASSPIQSLASATVSAIKTDANIVTPNENKSKDILSESWEERRLNDWDENKLKELLDEAYSYKNPRDKENKSKTFLQLLEKVQNDDQSYPFRAITSRGSRNLSSSITSNSYHHYQNPHYHSHSHNHNRSHHHHKQGGSLQDLFEIGLHEAQLDGDQSFGAGIGGNQRTRRQNHNSRQKKYSSSVSSRQREGGSLPSNVNVTHQISGSGNELGFMQQEGSSSNCATSKVSKKEHRRNAAKTAAGVGPPSVENKDSGSTISAVDTSSTLAPAENTSVGTNAASFVAGGGDFIIDMGEPIIDIQQQQKILQSKGQDSTKQGQSFYERLVSIDKRIPRVNLIGSTKSSYFAPTTSHCYVDETVRFNTLERNGGTATNNNSNAPTTVDAKFLPLDENYKACKSVLGGDGEKSPELIGKQKTNSIYTKISSPVSGSSSLGGTTNNIATLTQRQLDENGNALSEIYQNSSAVGGAGTGTTMQINCVSPTTASSTSAGILLTSCGGNNVSTSATVTIPPHPTSNTVSTSATITTYAAGSSQAKAKAKKKSQQERNTKTVDVESVAGYRGKDPVEELVKYIESSGEGGGGSTKSGDKKKERKKDKEKHQKLKKSNSLEELRSGAKMEVHELKRTAATTESNAVILRQKSGTGGGKQTKNNSSSSADINKNLESKPTNTNSRKTDRRSWGNEDLKYLEDQQNANYSGVNEEKAVAGPTTITISAPNPNKERKSAKAPMATREEREIKDRTAERNERNLTNSIVNYHNAVQQQQIEKLEKQEKLEKPDRTERRKRYDTPPNAVTIVDIVPMESSCPETAEFHVVTKKKKPKKPKVITNSEETSVTFNRTHNFTIQKTSTQSIPRYKYHQHEGNNASGNQQQHQYNSNSIGGGGGVPTNCYSSSSSQQQYQQNTETYNNTDKSRRKSTSSVPPSEKSDSSDLDSVHSLPIESTKANATKDSSQQKMKGPKAGIPPLASNKNNTHAPISYADIARTNKEIADAAAAFSVNEATPFETKNLESIAMDDRPSLEDKPTVNVNMMKTQKSKKSQIKQDFPELVGPVSNAPVTYSQSLSTATNTTQNHAAGLAGSPASDASPTTQPDVITKVSLPPEQNHPPQNPQTLQKSKSVENDSTTSNSTMSYMAPLNSNSLDQQYPALEKTVKRHSSANISVNYMTSNQTSTFNFAAAAKQQISASNTEPTNVNCNKNSALTTSTNTNTQMAALAANNATIISITTSNTNNNTNRKSKERSPPITTQNATLDTVNSKKSKKERQQLQQCLDSSTASQSKISNTAILRKPYRNQLKSSNSLPHTTSTQTNPRPAVIILNDDRNSSGCAADNQFTFGDFNEDELKLFEDDLSSTNNHTGDTANVIENQSLSEDQRESCDGETLKSPLATYFNDSGASCDNDMVNNSTSDILLNSSIDASSPNTSFVNNIHSSRGSSAGGHMAAASNNQSSDSGIYTDKSKSTSSSQHITSRQSNQTSPTRDDNKLNTFLSNTKCASVHTSMDSLDPHPQQLETCNDIETAIIAAARAAAKHQQKHQQKHQFKNSNSSSNSSSFSSSSLSSTAPYHSSHSKNFNQHGIISSGSNNNSHQQQQETLYDVADNDESFDNTPRSRSPSRPRRISIQYIPPTMATALTTQQHNEIIVDFIGSAWEEIANSKVTKVYDGQ